MVNRATQIKLKGKRLERGEITECREAMSSGEKEPRKRERERISGDPA